MMSSFLRLSSIDRPSLGLSKRFTLLSNNTLSSVNDAEQTSSFTSLHTLPSVEQLAGDDFANMFDISDDEYGQLDMKPTTATDTIHVALPELSATPSTQNFTELHGNSSSRAELAAVSTPTRRRELERGGMRPRLDQNQIIYRSSVSSSNPSTRRSNASSRLSRKSSVSSMTEEGSSSERSSKDSDKENALHERLMMKRSSEKRVSFSGRTTQLSFRASSETNLLEGFTVSKPRTQTISPAPNNSESASVRPVSRGKRLGQAMADGLATSPPPTPRSSTIRSNQTDNDMPSKVPVSRLASQDSSSAISSKTFPMSAVDNMDRVRVGIMSHLDNVTDLKSCAQVSRDFYITFHKYETILVDCVLYKQSRAAWELRHSVRHLEKPSPFRLRSVQKDYATIYALEDFLLWRCQSVLRPQSLKALLGELPNRKAELENAIWMVWTFCNVFGKTSISTDVSVAKQTQWLNAGPKRTSQITTEENVKIQPCSMRELEDMSEIWRCLEMLLSGFKGRENEARQAGLFKNVKETETSDRDLLSAWIQDILSLGPKAVLTLSSCDFEQAKVLGITRWTPPSKGKSRVNFLKAAVEEVYRDRLMKEARKKALDYRRSVQHHHTRSVSDPAFSEPQGSTQPRIAALNRHSLKVDTRRVSNPAPQNSRLAGNAARVEIRPDCDPLSSSSANLGPILSPSTNPMVFSPLSMTQNASTRLGATLFPIQNRDQSQRYSIPISSLQSDQGHTEPAVVADVIDPADKALALLVQEMGFAEKEAKRALALSDTGAGINVQLAIEMLSAGQVGRITQRKSRLSELPAGVGNAQLARKRSRREICEGHCKPMLLVEPKRERVSGLGVVKRNLSYRMSFRKSNRLSVIVDDEESNAHTTSQSGSESSTIRSASSTKRSSVLTNLAENSISTFTSPALQQCEQFNKADTPEQSPVSPITPMVPDWLKPDANPMANPQAYTDTNTALNFPAKPRITLQKVGTGMRKQGWGLPGRKKKDEIIRPEIIGYAY